MVYVDYECAGLVLRSAVPIAAPLADPAAMAGDPATVVTIDEEPPRPQPFERPSPEVVAEIVRDGIAWWTLCKTGDGYVCRFFRVGDFEIDASLDRVVCVPVDDGSPELIPVLLTGTIAALVLVLRGWCVLHASAVEVDGRALAFVGPSGQGKTTVAAMLCAAGAPLVTDDVLPVLLPENGGGTVTALRSAHELRLRPKAQELAGRFPGAAARITADERHAVAPPTSPSRRLALGTIAVPMPDRSIERVRVRRLPAGEAALWLGRSLRIEGWQRPVELRRHFLDVTRIIQFVPVLEVAIPWGPPYPADLAEQILQACP